MKPDLVAPGCALRALLLLTDIGFLVYWAASLMHLLPAAYLFKDYDNPILFAWNWSFFPLDMLASGLGLLSLTRARRGMPWRSVATMALTLTFCAGLLAVAFWTLRHDFNPLWWAPNLFLIVWPLVFLPQLAQAADTTRARLN